MKRIALACLFGCALLACNDDASVSPGVAGEGSSRTIEPTDGWSLQQTQSQIDGAKLTAARSYEFPDRGARFDVESTCIGGDRWEGMVVSSYVGEEGTGEGSAFVVRGASPHGRLKRAFDHQPEPLNYKFGIRNYNNEIALIVGALDQHHRDVLKGALQDGKKPPAASIFATMLPMVLEVHTGRGAFELAIEANGPLMSVLRACGAMPLASLQPASPPTVLATLETLPRISGIGYSEELPGESVVDPAQMFQGSSTCPELALAFDGIDLACNSWQQTAEALAAKGFLIPKEGFRRCAIRGQCTMLHRPIDGVYANFALGNDSYGGRIVWSFDRECHADSFDQRAVAASFSAAEPNLSPFEKGDDSALTALHRNGQWKVVVGKGKPDCYISIENLRTRRPDGLEISPKAPDAGETAWSGAPINRDAAVAASTSAEASPPALRSDEIRFNGPMEGGDGSLTMRETSDGWEASLLVSSEDCIGTIEGQVSGGPVRGSVVLVEEEDGARCVVTLHHDAEAQSMKVTEENCGAYHGASCAFNGTLRME